MIDWESSFNPEQYIWAIDKNSSYENSEWVKLIPIGAPDGYSFRIGKCRVTLTDIIAYD